MRSSAIFKKIKIIIEKIPHSEPNVVLSLPAVVKKPFQQLAVINPKKNVEVSENRVRKFGKR